MEPVTPSSQCRIITDPLAVENRLRELHSTLTTSALVQSLGAGLAAKNSCTAHHGKTYPGTVMHFESTRRLRDLLVMQRWGAESLSNFEITVSPGKVIAIAISGGDIAVGNQFRMPMTRNDKGIVTQRVVAKNHQAALPFLEILQEAEKHNSKVFDKTLPVEVIQYTWFLLHCVIGGELKSELSLPQGMDDFGKITMWSERLILPSIPLDAKVESRPEDNPVIPTIEIRRRG